jgi:type II secretion system protein H
VSPRPGIRAASRSRSAGFTLIEILVVVLIIGILSSAMLLSVNLTGRDRELEKESDRLLTLINYAREQAELQTREYGLLFNDDGYQFLAYDVRRGLWREVYEDEIFRQRKLPDGLDFKLTVDARPVVLVPTGDVKSTRPKDEKKQARSISDISSLKDAVSAVHKLGEDDPAKLADARKIVPQVTIFSNGDLTSFEATVEREGGVRSVTLAIDEKGQVVARPMVETRS